MPRDYTKSTLEFRLKQQHGECLPEILRDLYEVKGMTTREVMKALGFNSLTGCRRLLESNGIKVRRGSDAVAHQWKRNPDRKRGVAAQRFAAMVRDRATRGEHWAKGLTKDSDPRLASISNKLKSSGRLATRAVIDRATDTKKRMCRANPMLHSQAHAKPYPAEEAFADWLTVRGRVFVFQHPIIVGDDLMFIDFFLPAINLGIEVYRNRAKFSPERARKIYAAGIVPMGVPNWSVLNGDLSYVDDAIARAERGEFNPTTFGECWVVRRPYKSRAPGKTDLDEPIR